MKVLVNGPEPDEATLIVILLHEQNATGDDIMGLSVPFEDDDICWLAPTALNNSWFPHSPLERRSRNEPYLSLSAEQIKGLIDQFPSGKVVLAGFAQGACLVAELLTRHSPPLAGAFLFSGGFIGEEDEYSLPEKVYSNFPVSLSGSSRDPIVPESRLQETARRLERMGATVQTLFHDVASHEVAAEEIELAKKVLQEARQRLG